MSTYLAETMPTPTVDHTMLRAALLIGPMVTAWLVARYVDGPATGHLIVGLVAIMWSPLWFAIPGWLLGDARDWALNNWWSATAWKRWALSAARGIALMPYLMVSPRSTVRVEVVLSLLGWLVALGACVPLLTA